MLMLEWLDFCHEISDIKYFFNFAKNLILRIKMRTKIILVFAFFCFCDCFCGFSQAQKAQKSTLVHVKGCQSLGIHGGVGTKNKYDVGLTYNYVFDKKISLLVELDHEEATFGYSDFVNVLLLSPGIEYNIWNPAKWLYWHIDGGASIGYDKWTADIVNDEVKGFVYGANVGTGFEFLPCSNFSINLKTQQFLLFGNDDNYLKPNFTLGFKYNFHF